ncbi:cytochrome P450 [Rhodococcus sp. 27YEA15]|uniref:cytochrome P450 n=1 Tax=Rhodococcus sp. 27YEA15 TaxID=3156259 RepID=UPI003C7A9357
MTATESLAGSQLLTEVIVGGLQDPFPKYDELRELDEGVHWSNELNAWFVTRASDLRAMGDDPDTYSNDMAAVTGANAHNPADPVEVKYAEIADKFLFFLDPPEHTAVRSIFRHAFTPQAIKGWRPTVEQIADDLLAEYDYGDQVDFMERLAAKIPIEVIATILGVPREDFPMFATWTDALSLSTDPSVQGEARTAAIYTAVELIDYMDAIAVDRKKNPKDDLISLIVNTTAEDGSAIDHKTALSQAVILLAAGNDTTTNLLGNGISILIDRPELKTRLLEDPKLFPKTVEEILRFDPPFHLDFRKAARDHELGGREIKAQTPVFHLIAAANRDPREFPDPLVFDIDRKNKRHMSFSHGIHFCVGAPLARMEGAVGLERILKKFPGITHGSSEPTRKVTNVVARGWQHRPVTLER